MTNKKDKITLDEALAMTIADAPTLTTLGDIAFQKESLEVKKELMPISAKKRSVKRLKELQKKLKKDFKEEKKDFSETKSNNPLEPNIKGVAEEAVSELCAYFRCSTGYNADWLKEIIYSNWQSGRKIKYTYEQRIRCCQLIHFLINAGMSQRQAFTYADKIYGFNDTDAKDTYPYFLEKIKEYYFPDIKYKKYTSILVLLNIIEYGELFINHSKQRHIASFTTKSKDIFENTFQNSIQLLKNEISYVQENNLEKIGIEINPIIPELIHQEYPNLNKLILEIKKNKEIKWEFIFYTRQFIYDMDLYKLVEAK